MSDDGGPPEAPPAGEILRFVITPGGLRTSEQVVPVEPDTRVRLGPRRRASPERPERPDGTVLLDDVARANWIVATYSQGGVIDEFVADIVVPAEPAQHDGQLLYVFIGLQDEPTTMILQPVLQWGAPGDPPGWRLCSWVVDRQTNVARPTQSVAVAAGTRVTGRVSRTARRGSRFDYTCGFDGHPETSLAITGPGLGTAVAVLEAYRVHGAADYPPGPPIRVDHARLRPARPAGWNKQDLVIDYGQHAEIVSGSEPCAFELHCRA